MSQPRTKRSGNVLLSCPGQGKFPTFPLTNRTSRSGVEVNGGAPRSGAESAQPTEGHLLRWSEGYPHGEDQSKQ